MTYSLYDLLIIGGGINGVSIARDAAGRGLSVLLVEQDDLASHTSSASSKLAHGGLRYLARGDVRLVRESLQERKRLLANAPHICRPLRFVLPTRLLHQPRFVVGAGLWIYDHLGGATGLPSSAALDLSRGVEGRALKSDYQHGFSFMDGWVEDMRLVVLTAVAARRSGATIRTRTRFSSATPMADGWQVYLTDTRGTGQTATEEVHARCIINTAGPWVGEVHRQLNATAPTPVKLVRGSHIIVPRLYEGNWAYVLPGDDGRVVFALPFESDFTLIGTTDVEVSQPETQPVCSLAERDYLLNRAGGYFRQRLDPSTIVHSYAGLRALYDNGKGKAQDLTRDYKFIRQEGPAPALHVYGGKITTARCLAERALDEIAPFFPELASSPVRAGWTKTALLPGGDLGGTLDDFMQHCQIRWPWLDQALLQRYVFQFGSQINGLLDGTTSKAGLGAQVLPQLYEIEIDWLMKQEFAQTAEDIVWRRTRLGLRLVPQQIEDLAERL